MVFVTPNIFETGSARDIVYPKYEGPMVTD